MTAEQARTRTDSGRAIGRAEVSAAVLEAAAEVFGRPVAESDNFFDRGGDSVTAVDLTVRLEEAFGVELDMYDLLETDDFAGFVDLLTDRLDGAADRGL